jgi:hypothetical protein
MAFLRTEISIAAAPAAVWEVVRDFAAGPLRMAPGFVVGCQAEGDVRIVTFVDGTVVHERFLALDDDGRRLGYAVVGGSVRPDHDVAEMQVVPDGGGCRFVWTHDVRPDELGPGFQASMDRGAEVIKRTLEGRSGADARVTRRSGGVVEPGVRRPGVVEGVLRVGEQRAERGHHRDGADDDPGPAGHLCALSFFLWARRKASTTSGT